MNKKQVSVIDITGSKYATLLADGEKVLSEVLLAARESSGRILISFVGIELVTSLFLHSCVAEIYNPEYASLGLEDRTSAIADNNLVRSMIKREIEEAKKYFSNKELYDLAYSSQTPY